MKTIGRILIILAVFLAVSGLMVVVVNASGANAPDFGGDAQFRPGGENGTRPEGDQNRPERHEGGPGGGGSRMMFGLVKNVGVMAVIVALIAWPRSAAKKRKKQTTITSSTEDAK
jgi:hypothetical protein